MSDLKENFNNDIDDGIEFIDDEPYTDKERYSFESESYNNNSGNTSNKIPTNDNNYTDDNVPDRVLVAAERRRRKNKQQVTVMSEVISYIKIILIAIAIAFIFTQYIIVNAMVPSGSMMNTIMEHDRLIGFRLAYLFSDPQRGDIVIFKFPDDETQNYVKRVIGLPGDVVQIKNSQVIVNGEVLQENYLREEMITGDTELTYVVPDGHYFMLGDNRNTSKDSRYWENTFVAKNKILAKVIFRYYSGEHKSLNFKIIK